MELASLATLSSHELPLHRAQFPAPYEKLITTSTHIHRYYGHSPLLCYGEYVRECLNKPHHLSVYLEQRESHSWYGCVMDADGVLQEKIGSFSLLMDVFSYDIHQAKHVYTSSTLPSLEGMDEKQIEPVSQPLFDEGTLSPYRLTKFKAKGNRINTIVFLMMVMGAGVFFLMPEDAPPKPVVITLSPEAQWLSAYQDAVIPSTTLNNAERALVMGALMPDGVEANKIVLNDKRLDMSLTLLNTSNRKEWTQWQQRHPTQMSYYSKKEGEFHLPLATYHAYRELPIYNKENEQQLIQQWQLLGIVVALMPEASSTTQRRLHDYQLTLTGLPLGALSTLSESLQSPMLTLNQLDLSLDKGALLSGQLHLTLQGVTP